MGLFNRLFGRAHKSTTARAALPRRRVVLEMERLEDRQLMSSTPIHYLATGTDAGSPPLVNVHDGATNALKASIMAFNPSFTGGVRVAAGDVNGDGTPDIICGAGINSGPQVSVFDGHTSQLFSSFYAFPPTFSGGVYVAAINFNPQGSGGVFVAGSNLNGSADIVVSPGYGGPPQVDVYNGSAELISRYAAFSGSFTGGLRVGSATINGTPAVITGFGPGAGPVVQEFDEYGRILDASFSYAALGPERHLRGRDLKGARHRIPAVCCFRQFAR